jgi:hypothetical protein
MTTEELQKFYNDFVNTVGEKEADSFFRKSQKAIEKNPKKFKNQISFASKLM